MKSSMRFLQGLKLAAVLAVALSMGACANKNLGMDANASAANDFQPRCALEQFGGDFRRRPNRQSVVIANDLGELVLVESGLDVDLDPSLRKDCDGRRGKLVGNENA